MGKIDRIELNNFKSYKGPHTIGPFLKFTSVIGPNGSGKSNLMDAISFVLGVKTGQLRGANLSQLIYTVPNEQAVKRRCYVSLVYNTGDDDEMGEDRVFTRSIKSDGGSEYRIDNLAVSAEVYVKTLEEMNIVVKTRNFLVFQGDVESIASKTPKELTSLIEQISGSGDMKLDYDNARLEKEQAEDNALFAFQKRKGITAERKQYKEQKEEAEKFTTLQNSVSLLRLDHLLLQLQHISQEMTRLETDVEQAQAKLEDLNEKKGSANEKLKAVKKEQAQIQKGVLTLEKKISKAKEEVESRRPSQIKVKEEELHTSQRVSSNKASLESIRKEHEGHEKHIKDLSVELETFRHAAKDFEEDVKRESEKEQIDLAKLDEHLADYNNLKQEAGRKTAVLRGEYDNLSRAQKADQENAESLRAKLREINDHVKQLQETREKLITRLNKGKEVISKTEQSRRQLDQQINGLKAEDEKNTARQKSLRAELEDLQSQLLDMKTDKRENNRDKKMVQALETLKRLFPGVRGKMTDLVQSTQRRYNVALSIAMGRLMDAIIVDHERTGKECIQYLREQRMDIMTFLPLDSLICKPIKEKLRQLPNAKLVLDLIKYDPSLQQAVLYAVGNTLVCENTADARKIAFGGAERNRVVTIQGLLIEKAGLFTGGSGGAEERAHKWDEKRVDDLKRKRDKVLRDLSELDDSLKTFTHLQQLQQQLQAVEGRIKYTEADVNMTNERIKKGEEEQRILQKEIHSLQPELDKKENAMKTRETEIDKVLKSIREVEDKVFAEFSKRVGVKNVREWEENRLLKLQERSKTRLDFSTQISRLNNQLEYEKKRDVKGPMDRLQKQIKEDEKTLTKLREEIKKVTAEIEKSQSGLDDLKKSYNEAKSKVNDKELEIKELKKHVQEVENSIANLNKEVTAKETLIDQLRARRHTLYRSSKVEEIKLPRLKTKSQTQTKTRKQKKPKSGEDAEMESEGEEEEEESTPMDVDESSLELDSGPTVPADSQKDQHKKEDAIQIDFSGLQGKYKIKTSKEYDDVIAGILHKIGDISTEMDKLAPNLKAINRLEDVDARLKTTNVEFETIRQKAKDSVDKFNLIKQERCDKFMNAFNEISSHIDQIYKDLTRTPDHDHPSTGTAYLNLDNHDEPYLHGIKYTAMPPQKRFIDMDQLSGGEKTVAALALLFAIHKFRPAPFFILDEVDAALDSTNVNRVARYIRERSTTDIQFIVISLKDSFFEKSEALVGIARDQALRSSKTYTLNITSYEDEK